MSKQWPDLKKEMDNIQVPLEKLDKIIKNTAPQLKKKKSKLKIVSYTAGAAAVALFIFVGSASVSPAMAKIASHVPLIGTFFNDVQDEGLQIAGQKGLTQIIDQSSKDSGITLTITEMFYDGTRLVFGYTQESLFAIGELERPTFEVNGREINFSSSYSGDFITPQKYKGMVEINPTEELPEEFELNMRIDAIGVIPGNWNFQFHVKQSNQVMVLRPEEVKMIEGANVKINSLKIGPAGTDLAVQVNSKEEMDFQPFDLEFFVVDDGGNVLDQLGKDAHGETENGVVETQVGYLFSPLKEGAKKLRVIPYKLEDNFPLEKVMIPLEGQKYPFKFSQGDFGAITVTEIQSNEEQIIVYFDVNSESLYDNRLTRNPIWLEDEHGNSLVLEEAPFAKRIEGNSFKQVFKASEIERAHLATFQYPKPIMYDEFELQVPDK